MSKKPKYKSPKVKNPGKRRRAESVALKTPDFLAEQKEKFQELFPHVFTEGKIDVEKLRAALGDAADERPERYSFTWAGKRAAMLELQKPAWGTLVPAKDESVNFDTTQNLFIEGENLEVLKLLYKSYFGRVKMIYIDPPYNTGGDFVYPDNFADPKDSYLKITGQKDAEGNLLTSNPESSGRYHSSWLSMMYPRLFLARQLLREDGVIFVSVDDHEFHNLRFLMDEIFGEENRIENFVWKKSYGGGAKEKFAITQHEYILLYGRNLTMIDDLWLPPDTEAEARYYKYSDNKVQKRGPYRLKPLEATKSMDRRENLIFKIPAPDGSEVLPKRQWWWKKERVLKALANDELAFTKGPDGWSVSYKQYLRDEEGNKRGAKPFSVIDGIYTQHGTADLNAIFGEPPVMQFPKPVALMRKFLNIGTGAGSDDLVIDFFAGSCSLAQGVIEQNQEDGGGRRFIAVQLPEPTPKDSAAWKARFRTVADIGKVRIRKVIEGREKKNEGNLLNVVEKNGLGLRVFKLAPSNFKPWVNEPSSSPETLAKAMELFNDPLADGWKSENVIYEVTLKEGFSLTSRIEKDSTVKANKVFSVTDAEKGQSFRICLDDELKAATVKELNLKKDDLFICRDVAIDDKTAANLALQCRLKTI
jgi:adenine-specific DNA-methyltransferase